MLQVIVFLLIYEVIYAIKINIFAVVFSLGLNNVVFCIY